MATKKRKEYDRVIITDEKNVPMAWQREQLCYCTDDRWEDEHHPVRSYTVATAKRHIANTIKFRTAGNMEPGHYRTMPFAG